MLKMITCFHKKIITNLRKKTSFFFTSLFIVVIKSQIRTRMLDAEVNRKHFQVINKNNNNKKTLEDFSRNKIRSCYAIITARITICSYEVKSVIVGGSRLEYYPSRLNAFSDELITVRQFPLMKNFTLCSLHHDTVCCFHINEKKSSIHL